MKYPIDAHTSCHAHVRFHGVQTVHCKILPSEDGDGCLLINGKSYGEKFKTLDDIVARLAKAPPPPKWPVQLTEAMGVDGETFVLSASKQKKKKKKKASKKIPKNAEPEPEPEPEPGSQAAQADSLPEAGQGSSSVDITPPPPAPTVGSVLVVRESPNADFGFALGECTVRSFLDRYLSGPHGRILPCISHHAHTADWCGACLAS